jgi:hypothetical protein
MEDLTLDRGEPHTASSSREGSFHFGGPNPFDSDLLHSDNPFESKPGASTAEAVDHTFGSYGQLVSAVRAMHAMRGCVLCNDVYAGDHTFGSYGQLVSAVRAVHAMRAMSGLCALHAVYAGDHTFGGYGQLVSAIRAVHAMRAMSGLCALHAVYAGGHPQRNRYSGYFMHST